MSALPFAKQPSQRLGRSGQFRVSALQPSVTGLPGWAGNFLEECKSLFFLQNSYAGISF